MGKFNSLMTLDIYRSIIRACPVLMRPIIRILLKAGINYKQFAKITREVFVEVATEDFGINGRKTNTSRVAIITGISRSEVTKIKKKYEENVDNVIPHTFNNASRLLSGWHVDPDYLDSKNKPKVLFIDGPEPNFTTLMNQYGGDIPATAMLKELKSVNAVKVETDGSISALQRYFMPVNYDENRIFSLIDDFVDLGNTSYHNFNRNIGDDSFFQMKVTNDYITANAVPLFKKMVEERGISLLEEFDDWLALNEIETIDGENSEGFRVGLGMYFISEQK